MAWDVKQNQLNSIQRAELEKSYKTGKNAKKITLPS